MPIWASRHPCRPRDSGLRIRSVGVPTAIAPCIPLTRKQGVNPPLHQGYPPAFGGAPSHLPRSQSLACADGSHPRRPSLTPLPPCIFALVPVDRVRSNRSHSIPGPNLLARFLLHPDSSITPPRDFQSTVPRVGIDRGWLHCPQLCHATAEISVGGSPVPDTIGSGTARVPRHRVPHPLGLRAVLQPEIHACTRVRHHTILQV